MKGFFQEHNIILITKRRIGLRAMDDCGNIVGSDLTRVNVAQIRLSSQQFNVITVTPTIGKDHQDFTKISPLASMTWPGLSQNNRTPAGLPSHSLLIFSPIR